MTVIAIFAMKCPNSKSQFIWDECYSNNCDEMSKYEVSFWSKMVWVRASVISDKSSMRIFAMKCPNVSIYLKWFE